MECTEVEGFFAKIKMQNTHAIGIGKGLWTPSFPRDLRLFLVL